MSFFGGGCGVFFVSPYEGSVLLYSTFLHRVKSNLQACSIKRACFRLLLCPGIDRRCGRCYLSPCFLLRHMETIRSSPRKIQLAIASPGCSLLSSAARVSGVHLPSLSGTWLFWAYSSCFGNSGFIQRVTFSTPSLWPAKIWCLWICLFLYGGLCFGARCNVVAMLFA